MYGNEADYMEDASELGHCHAVFDLPRQMHTEDLRIKDVLLSISLRVNFEHCDIQKNFTSKLPRYIALYGLAVAFRLRAKAPSAASTEGA